MDTFEINGVEITVFNDDNEYIEVQVGDYGKLSYFADAHMMHVLKQIREVIKQNKIKNTNK